MMATCKECLHYEACVPYADDQCAGNGWETRWADGCENFKHRSRFVELPVKIGDYACAYRYRNNILVQSRGDVTGMFFTQDMRLFISVGNVAVGEWGKTVFPRNHDPSREDIRDIQMWLEEAEKALAERSRL